MSKDSSLSLRQVTAYLGFASIGLFCGAVALFAWLNPGFGLVQDYVSKLGARGQPFALWWNLVGFASVGLLFAAFGWAYGRILEDRLAGILFTLFGVGYAVTSVPTDLADAASPLSKAHTVTICLALACWLFGLARLGGCTTLRKTERHIANSTAVLLVLPILGFLLGLWSMPVTHRLVFCVVFSWVVVTSVRLLREDA